MPILIKIDGETPLPMARRAPRCWACIPDNANRLARGLPQHPQGTPEFQGLVHRKKDGKVFSVWKCTQCRHVEVKHEATRNLDLEKPWAPIIPESMYPQVTHAVVT